jgi:hypothetical protein
LGAASISGAGIEQLNYRLVRHWYLGFGLDDLARHPTAPTT